ncbi:hypothetical protein C0U41_15645 [Klebsiella pneumoniae]|nr:hypothetical protein C0U41_15645 [Klebsiella pneumoniae]PSC90377.1 hypothetical protein C7D71_15895 [Klebsiella pneumoniae]
MTNTLGYKQSWHHILLNLSLADIHNFNPTLSLSVFLTQGAITLWLCTYTRHTSSCMCVGFPRSPQSLT